MNILEYLMVKEAASKGQLSRASELIAQSTAGSSAVRKAQDLIQRHNAGRQAASGIRKANLLGMKHYGETGRHTSPKLERTQAGLMDDSARRMALGRALKQNPGSGIRLRNMTQIPSSFKAPDSSTVRRGAHRELKRGVTEWQRRSGIKSNLTDVQRLSNRIK